MAEREKLYNLMTDSKNPAFPWFPNNAEMLRFADYLIANGVTIQQWIPVTERLPKEERRYLCVVRIGYSGAVYVTLMNGDPDGFSLEHIYNDDVTHWMPLPEPPKEDTK